MQNYFEEFIEQSRLGLTFLKPLADTLADTFDIQGFREMLCSLDSSKFLLLDSLILFQAIMQDDAKR